MRATSFSDHSFYLPLSLPRVHNQASRGVLGLPRGKRRWRGCGSGTVPCSREGAGRPDPLTLPDSPSEGASGSQSQPLAALLHFSVVSLLGTWSCARSHSLLGLSVRVRQLIRGSVVSGVRQGPPGGLHVAAATSAGGRPPLGGRCLEGLGRCAAECGLDACLYWSVSSQHDGFRVSPRSRRRGERIWKL